MLLPRLVLRICLLNDYWLIYFRFVCYLLTRRRAGQHHLRQLGEYVPQCPHRQAHCQTLRPVTAAHTHAVTPSYAKATALPSPSGAINSGYIYGISYSDTACASTDSMFVYQVGVCIKASAIKFANYVAFPARGYFNVSYLAFNDNSCTSYNASLSSILTVTFGSCATGEVYGYSAVPPTVPRTAGIIDA